MIGIAEHDNLGAALGRSLQKDDAQVSTPTEAEWSLQDQTQAADQDIACPHI